MNNIQKFFEKPCWNFCRRGFLLFFSFVSREVEFVSNAVFSKLGGFDIEKTVTLTTTHIVCGDEKRTLNLMKGIAYGCWVLNKDWVRLIVF